MGIAALCFLSAAVMQRIPFKDQFVIPWTATRTWLLEGVSPYDESVIKNAEDTLSDSRYLGSLDSTALIEPAINLVFYLPFSLIPYEISRAIWMFVLMAAAGAIGHFGLLLSGWKVSRIERIVLFIVTVLWLPGASSILTGQLTPIIIFLILASIYLILRGKDTQAGFLLALTFGSIQISILILIVLLVWCISRRRWSIIFAYFSGIIFLFILTLLLIPSWPLDWLRVILNIYTDFSWIHTPLMSLADILPGIAYYLSVFLHILFAIYFLFLGVTLLRKSGREFTWKIFSLLVIAFLFHTQATIDHVFLVLPAAFLMFRFWSERWRLAGRLLTWLLIALIVIGPWLTVDMNVSFVEGIALPVFIAGFPFLVIVGMVWIRWWAFNIPKLPFDGK
jgi:hypothetical protein